MTTETKIPPPVAEQPPVPDPHLAAVEPGRVRARLQDVLEGITRRFSQAPATLTEELAELEQVAAVQRLEPRHLAVRAGAALEVLDHLRAALADAELQHDGVPEREIDLARARLRGAVVHEAGPYEVPAAARARSIAAVTR